MRGRRVRATTVRCCDWQTCAGNLHPNRFVTIAPHLPSAGTDGAPLSTGAPPRRSILSMAFLMLVHSRSSSCTRFRMLSISSRSIWLPCAATRHVPPSSLSPPSSPDPSAPPSFAVMVHAMARRSWSCSKKSTCTTVHHAAHLLLLFFTETRMSLQTDQPKQAFITHQHRHCFTSLQTRRCRQLGKGHRRTRGRRPATPRRGRRICPASGWHLSRSPPSRHPPTSPRPAWFVG